MEEKVLNTLTSKVTELMQKYQEMCDANDALRNELVSAKAQNEAKSNQIARLEEELELMERKLLKYAVKQLSTKSS